MRPDRPPWTAAEEDQLHALAGDMPLGILVQQFHVWAKENGGFIRTASAIERRLQKLKLSGLVRTGEWVTTGGAAEILGCPIGRVEGWVQSKTISAVLEPQWYSGRYYISRSSWRRLARKMPRILGGFPADRLFQLLEDRKLADSVAIRYPYSFSDWRVRCVETGKVWPNAPAAAAELHVTRSAITESIRKRRSLPALGLRFEALREAAG